MNAAASLMLHTCETVEFIWACNLKHSSISRTLTSAAKANPKVWKGVFRLLWPPLHNALQVMCVHVSSARDGVVLFCLFCLFCCGTGFNKPRNPSCANGHYAMTNIILFKRQAIAIGALRRATNITNTKQRQPSAMASAMSWQALRYTHARWKTFEHTNDYKPLITQTPDGSNTLVVSMGTQVVWICALSFGTFP